MDLESSSHDDHVELCYALDVENPAVKDEWIPPLPEFDVDWNIYFGEHMPTIEAQQESQDGPETMKTLDVTTSNDRGKKRRQMSGSEGAETLRYREALLPVDPSMAHCMTDNLWSDSGSEQMFRATPSFFGPGTTVTAITPTSNLIASVMVGTIYASPNTDAYTFHCHDATCNDMTFSRWPDFTRHYNGAHATNPTVYWCDIEGCSRSKAAGNRPFPRKDKLNDHAKSIHGSRF